MGGFAVSLLRVGNKAAVSDPITGRSSSPIGDVLVSASGAPLYGATRTGGLRKHEAIVSGEPSGA